MSMDYNMAMTKRKKMINQVMGYEPGKKPSKRKKRTEFVSEALKTPYSRSSSNRKFFTK